MPKDDRTERIEEAKTASHKRLRTLSRHKVREVRLAVTSRDDCPADILSDLTDDRTTYVRINVAKHANTPADCLDTLLSDSSANVMEAALSNDKANPDAVVASVTAATKGIGVSQRRAEQATKNRSLGSHHLADVTRRWVATLPAYAPYNADNRMTALRRIRRHPACDHDVLVELLPACATGELASEVLKHPAADADLLTEMAHSPFAPVRAVARDHPDCPEEAAILATLLDGGEAPATPQPAPWF